MTQKELLYLEDAIGHENNIVQICEETANSLHNDDLIAFIKEQKEEHVLLKNALMNMLKEKANE